MSDVWWFLSRSSGVVATVLLVAALICGLCVTARATGTKRRAAWWLDLHNALGGLALLFVVVHVVAVFEDELSGIGLTQLLVPLTATTDRLAIALGVVAAYVLAAVVLTSWPRRRGSRRTWLAIHLLSIPATLAAAFHAWSIGSSRDELWFRALLVLLVGLVTYPAMLRLLSLAARRGTTATDRDDPVADPAPSMVGGRS